VELRLGTAAYEHGRKPIRFGAHQFRYAALVATVRAGDGSVGVGANWAQLDDELSYAAAVAPAFSSVVVGCDGLSPHEACVACQAEASRIGAVRAGAAVEMALWDLAGQMIGAPVSQLLGRRHRELPSYAISAEDFFFESATQYVELVQRFVADGFRACKLHLWGKSTEDLAACRAIREAVGEDVVLMLDPAGRYSREDAVRVGQAIAELGFVRLEDPLPPDDAAGYRWLGSKISIPIVVNESLRWNLEQCRVAAQNGVVQGFRMEVGRAGLGEALRFCAMADANGAEIDIAAFAPRLGLETCFQLALASPATRWFEHHEAMGLEAIPGVEAGFRIDGGVARPLDLPGLGCRIDWTEFERHCQWV
jgi:L-alanine-DL-glutamate epimerase-like enolase superfamily enzyme